MRIFSWCYAIIKHTLRSNLRLLNFDGMKRDCFTIAELAGIIVTVILGIPVLIFILQEHLGRSRACPKRLPER